MNVSDLGMSFTEWRLAASLLSTPGWYVIDATPLYPGVFVLFPSPGPDGTLAWVGAQYPAVTWREVYELGQIEPD